MSDVDLILQIQEEVRSDPEPATLTMDIDVCDVVGIEIFLLESDNAIETFMAKFAVKYRHQFENPEVFDTYIREMQLKARQAIKDGISEAQQAMTLLGLDMSLRDPFKEEEGDDDGGV